MQLSEKPRQHLYTEDFFNELQGFSRQSAEEIVPLILEIITCERVVDVGCGDGTWLKVFHEYGVKEILGIDGSYVDENILVIPRENFIPFDLTKPLKLNEKFDLVTCFEVAEHLPAECAETFVDSLTSLGSLIFFSAAIPEQGGENHINEQWQEYWAETFQRRGYVAIDCLRKKIWSNKKVAFWYSQNILLFIQQEYLENNFLLKEKVKNFVVTNHSSLSIVHPMLYLLKSGKIEFPEQKKPEETSQKSIPGLLQRIVTKAFKKLVKFS
jgi:SAM-dependent methyltransferase